MTKIFAGFVLFVLYFLLMWVFPTWTGNGYESIDMIFTLVNIMYIGILHLVIAGLIGLCCIAAWAVARLAE